MRVYNTCRVVRVVARPLARSGAPAPPQFHKVVFMCSFNTRRALRKSRALLCAVRLWHLRAHIHNISHAALWHHTRTHQHSECVSAARASDPNRPHNTHARLGRRGSFSLCIRTTHAQFYGPKRTRVVLSQASILTYQHTHTAAPLNPIHCEIIPHHRRARAGVKSVRKAIKLPESHIAEH